MSKANGITKTKRPNPRLIERRLHQKRTEMKLSTRNSSLAAKISQMRLTIAPIVHVETGKPAPDFPSTMLSLFLLTEAQLDALAMFYSQTHCSELTFQYPITMNWAHPFLDKCENLPDDCRLDDVERLRVKMRMFARFIGMRGAETPTWEYERQMEILGNKIRWSVREEERAERKVFSGPASLP